MNNSKPKANAGRGTQVYELPPPELPDGEEGADDAPIIAQDASPAPVNGHPTHPQPPRALTPAEHAQKRWGVDWHEIDVDEGNRLLGDLREEFERAAKIMQQRQRALAVVRCHCGCGKEVIPGMACMSRTLIDQDTRLPYNVYFATQECVRQNNKKQYGMAELIR